MTQPLFPPSLFDFATKLSNCLCAILSDPLQPYTPVCRCCVRHNDSLPPMDWCAAECSCTIGNPPRPGNGEAWVRVVGYQVRQLVAARNASGRACGGQVLDITLQMGIYRCIEGILADDGEIPSCEELSADAALMDADASAMFKAATCCTELDQYRPTIGNYQPIGPAGNCAGGALTVTYTDVPLRTTL